MHFNILVLFGGFILSLTVINYYYYYYYYASYDIEALFLYIVSYCMLCMLSAFVANKLHHK